MFRYRLEPLLRYRKTLEDERKRGLAEANRRYYEELEKIDHMEHEKSAVMGEVTHMMQTAPDAGMLIFYDSYMKGVKTDIKYESEQAEQALQIVDMERQKLIEAVKKKKIIEAHREREWERYDAEESRKERIGADEMALMRFSRGYNPGA
ncbi:MAG: flagellar export protein FliJ [Nitrospinae bacterium]|nr:flagellar export protein FliJ [Nitrospinota bacterium]